MPSIKEAELPAVEITDQNIFLSPDSQSLTEFGVSVQGLAISYENLKVARIGILGERTPSPERLEDDDRALSGWCRRVGIERQDDVIEEVVFEYTRLLDARREAGRKELLRTFRFNEKRNGRRDGFLGSITNIIRKVRDRIIK